MLFISSDFWPNEVHSVDTAGGFTGAETGDCWLLGNAVCLQSMENSHGEIFFFTTGIVALKPLWQCVRWQKGWHGGPHKQEVQVKLAFQDDPIFGCSHH